MLRLRITGAISNDEASVSWDAPGHDIAAAALEEGGDEEGPCSDCCRLLRLNKDLLRRLSTN